MSVIETPRLRMRGHRVSDLPACAAMWADPGVTRHIGGRPFTTEETWGKILRLVGHWTLLGFGYWVVEERAGGAFVGEVGFADFKRELSPSIAARAELGWVLSPAMHGRGYATEAVTAALAWGEARFAGTPPVCIIDPTNQASIRVAEKCGFREWTRTTYKGDPTILYVHHRP